MKHREDLIAGRNAVIEALRAKKPIDKIYILDGCKDGPIRTIIREVKKTDAILMTPAEVWFLRAEAALRGWSGEDAGTCYEQGVRS